MGKTGNNSFRNIARKALIAFYHKQIMINEIA